MRGDPSIWCWRAAISKRCIVAFVAVECECRICTSSISFKEMSEVTSVVVCVAGVCSFFCLVTAFCLAVRELMSCWLFLSSEGFPDSLFCRPVCRVNYMLAI